MGGWKDTIRAEIEKGGKEPPCPFCALPRCRRSDYTRCAHCGINWMQGENLGQDPRSERMARFLEQARATSKARDEKKHE